MRRIGIMQGRLSPAPSGRFQCFPRASWREEFPKAQEAGFACIEWIVDSYGWDVNPLLSEGGIREMEQLSTAFGVAVRSVCADWFMEFPLLRTTGFEREQRLAVLMNLLERCGRLGMERIVLPFVDASRIDSVTETESLVAMLRDLLDPASKSGVELHLETSLDPGEFAALLGELPTSWLKVNYDSGNSASMGFDVQEEFAAYGTRVGSVHIKDRVRGGGTVPLGEGDVDFDRLWSELSRIGYGGDLVLQVARGAEGDELAWARQNRAFVRSAMDQRKVSHRP